MRPLRVRIDVTNGTATPAQPDPQTIHLNAAQSQKPQKRPPAQTTSPPTLPKEDPAKELLSQTPGQLYLPLLCPSDKKKKKKNAG